MSSDEPVWPDDARKILARLTELCTDGVDVALRLATLQDEARRLGRGNTTPEKRREMDALRKRRSRIHARIEFLRARLSIPAPPMSDRH